jgi:hypothetical protein
MTHIAEANDYRLATDGAVDVCAPSADTLFWRWWLEDVRRLQAALQQDAAALKEIAEWCKEQRQEVSSDDE